MKEKVKSLNHGCIIMIIVIINVYIYKYLKKIKKRKHLL